MGLKGIEGMPHLKRIVPTGSRPPLKQWIRREVLEVGEWVVAFR
jgi:hypothetical protein